MKFRLGQIAGRLDVDEMMAELPPELVVRWEAALTVLDLDASRWAAAKVCEVLHQVAERFASYDSPHQARQAMAALPTHEDFMELWTFGEPTTSIPFPIQSQEEIGRTLRGLRK